METFDRINSMNLLISGASSGLGLGILNYFIHKNTNDTHNNPWCISRNKPAIESDNLVHLPADLSDINSVNAILDSIKSIKMDLFIHCAGTWESDTVLENLIPVEIQNIINVNLSSFLGIAIGLKTSLLKSSNPLILAIGSTAGLDHSTGKRAIYAASKFGLRGAVHSLREYFRPDNIKVSIINPGGIAPYQLDDNGNSIESPNRVPIADFCTLIEAIRSLSAETLVKEISLPALKDHI
jgi:short-subunit dehydrogenase